MNAGALLLWAPIATLVLTGLMVSAQALGLSRMALPYLLGTMFTSDRDLARIAGTAAHLVIGLLFGLVYALVFEQWGHAGIARGALMGLVHAGVVLTAVIPLLPGVHPRMASEEQGPTVTRQLEPPGFFALNYGYRTPLSTVVAHLVYGAILGAFYVPLSAR